MVKYLTGMTLPLTSTGNSWLLIDINTEFSQSESSIYRAQNRLLILGESQAMQFVVRSDFDWFLTNSSRIKNSDR